jgi:hypothetical protein
VTTGTPGRLPIARIGLPRADRPIFRSGSSVKAVGVQRESGLSDLPLTRWTTDHRIGFANDTADTADSGRDTRIGGRLVLLTSGLTFRRGDGASVDRQAAFRLQQGVRLSEPDGLPITDGEGRGFGKSIDRVTDRTSHLLTAASKTNGPAPRIDMASVAPREFRTGFDDLPLVLQRVTQDRFVQSNVEQPPMLARWDSERGGDREARVIAAAPAAPVTTGSTIPNLVGTPSTPDADEIADRAWRSVMERLTIEQERRGFTRWP